LSSRSRLSGPAYRVSRSAALPRLLPPGVEGILAGRAFLVWGPHEQAGGSLANARGVERSVSVRVRNSGRQTADRAIAQPVAARFDRRYFPASRAQHKGRIGGGRLFRRDDPAFLPAVFGWNSAGWRAEILKPHV